MSRPLYEQARAYGVTLRNSSASRSKLDSAMRRGTSESDRVYNDGVRAGWEDQDAEIKAQRRQAR